MPNIKTVLFDLDDTLYDHTIVSRIALRETAATDAALRRANFDELIKVNSEWLEHFHIEVQHGRSTLERARVQRWQKLLEIFGGECSRAEELSALQRNNYLSHERLVDGAYDVLESLKTAGFALAIVSNNIREEQIGKLSRLGIAKYFDAVIVSADYGFAKPDARLFDVALDALGSRHEHSVHIGDSWNADVVGAQNAGIRPIWFNRFAKSAKIDGVVEFKTLRKTGSYVVQNA